MNMFMNKDIRFLIVAFDGLRPDMVDNDLMPNLKNSMLTFTS